MRHYEKPVADVRVFGIDVMLGSAIITPDVPAQ